MVALVQRVSKLEKKVALQSRTGLLEDQSMYQASEEDFAEAVAILVKCGAVREVKDSIRKRSGRSLGGIAGQAVPVGRRIRYEPPGGR